MDRTSATATAASIAAAAPAAARVATLAPGARFGVAVSWPVFAGSRDNGAGRGGGAVLGRGLPAAEELPDAIDDAQRNSVLGLRAV